MDDNIACQRCGWVAKREADWTRHSCGLYAQYKARNAAEFKQLQQEIRGTIGMSKANDRQEGGDHYRTPIQMWDFLLANNVPWLEGTIMCYVFRHRAKNGLADLRKAVHCLEKLIEVEEGKIVGNG